MHDDLDQVSVVDGMVVIHGPGSIAATMTPIAARKTGERLIAAAVEAIVAEAKQNSNAG